MLARTIYCILARQTSEFVMHHVYGRYRFWHTLDLHELPLLSSVMVSTSRNRHGDDVVRVTIEGVRPVRGRAMVVGKINLGYNAAMDLAFQGVGVFHRFLATRSGTAVIVLNTRRRYHQVHLKLILGSSPPPLGSYTRNNAVLIIRPQGSKNIVDYRTSELRCVGLVSLAGSSIEAYPLPLIVPCGNRKSITVTLLGARSASVRDFTGRTRGVVMVNGWG